MIVVRSLDLLDVGEAVARDDKARVAAWIEAGLLGKPSLETIERWSKAEGAGVGVTGRPAVRARPRGRRPHDAGAELMVQ